MRVFSSVLRRYVAVKHKSTRMLEDVDFASQVIMMQDMKIIRVPAPVPSPWEQLPTDLRLVLAWLGLVKTDLRTGQCTAHPSAPERLRKMARDIEAAYPEVEAVADDATGPLEESAKRVSLDVFRRAAGKSKTKTRKLKAV